MYRQLLVLFHCGANGDLESFFPSRCVTDGARDRPELFQHFALQERRGVFDPESLEGTLGEVAQELP